MKILIISTPRSGSTNLFNGLYKSMSFYRGFCEPFNPSSESLGDNNLNYSLAYNNVLVKILVWDLVVHGYYKNYYELISRMFYKKNFNINNLKEIVYNSLVEYIKNFDKVILLTRKNKKEAIKSMSHAMATGNYHSKYNYSKNNITFPLFGENIIYHLDNILHQISKNLNFPLNYYEDIFSGNLQCIDTFVTENNLYLDNKILYQFLDTKNRYKQN